MNITLLAVGLVMVLMIGFVLLILHGLSVSAGIKIRKDMIKLLESYDNVVDAKSRQIKQLQAQLEQLRQEQARLEEEAILPADSGGRETAAGEETPVMLPDAADYRHSDFADVYSTIRENFRVNIQDCGSLIEQVAQETENHPTGRGALAAELYKALSYETVFRMVQLPAQQQLEMLDTSLSDDDWTLLRDYCEMTQGRAFDVTRFRDWLGELAAMENNDIQVRVGDEQLARKEDAQLCPKICEGVQIVVGNKLYDYSINEREIC